MQYSQSLIEKDQYRKQVRGLEAERDELLTTVTSLEGAKALLEAQLQRTQGASCLKVSGARSIAPWGLGCCGFGHPSFSGKKKKKQNKPKQNYAGLRLGLRFDLLARAGNMWGLSEGV